VPAMEEETEPLRILVSGDRGAGKTTLCLKAVEALQKRGVRCGGVLCPKLLDGDGKVLGIEVLDLGESPPPRRVLARTDRRLDGPCTGAYHFSAEGFRFGQEALARGAAGADTLVADELGPLEMRGQGFVNLLELALDASIRLMIISVRPSLVEEVRQRLKGFRVVLVRVDAASRERAERELLGHLFAFDRLTGFP